mmetsp:Transcript_36779/g.88445  ORF Transcript_36779/g.88445 Transcript_36779/m.88445 type:complete len:201 (+) Transcript_36779:621-1223(+)
MRWRTASTRRSGAKAWICTTSRPTPRISPTWTGPGPCCPRRSPVIRCATTGPCPPRSTSSRTSPWAQAPGARTTTSTGTAWRAGWSPTSRPWGSRTCWRPTGSGRSPTCPGTRTSATSPSRTPSIAPPAPWTTAAWRSPARTTPRAGAGWSAPTPTSSTCGTSTAGTCTTWCRCLTPGTTAVPWCSPPPRAGRCSGSWTR